METILKTIKIGRNEFDVHKGDYILYNRNCYQFCAGDRRTLKHEKHTEYSNVRISDSLVKKLPFDKMRKELKVLSGVPLTYWYF